MYRLFLSLSSDALSSFDISQPGSVGYKGTWGETSGPQPNARELGEMEQGREKPARSLSAESELIRSQEASQER